MYIEMTGRLLETNEEWADQKCGMFVQCGECERELNENIQ